MPDYFTQTVLQETIPDADMTALERFLLSHVFQTERDGGAWYFFSEEGAVDILYVERAALETALAASEAAGNNVANVLVREQLAKLDCANRDAPHVDLDLSVIGWESIVQDVVRRSPTLDYISVISAFTCSRMCSDGLSGSVVVISADTILGKSTYDLLEEFIKQVAPG